MNLRTWMRTLHLYSSTSSMSQPCAAAQHTVKRHNGPPRQTINTNCTKNPKTKTVQQHDTDTRPCRRNRNVQKTEYCAKKVIWCMKACVYVSVQALTVYAHQIYWMTKTVRTLLRNKNTAFRPAEVCSTVQANPEMGMRQGKLDYTNTIEDNLCSNNLRMVRPKYH